MQGFEIRDKLRCFFFALLVVAFPAGCSRCTTTSKSTTFVGFTSHTQKEVMTQASDGAIEFETPELGMGRLEVPVGAVAIGEKIHIETGVVPALDEEFRTHPYTSGLRKVDGSITIVLGKSQPIKPIRLCLNRARIYAGYPNGELISLAYSYYDGDNETLSYFTRIEQKVQSGEYECLVINPDEFSNLDNADGNFETAIVFAVKEKRP